MMGVAGFQTLRVLVCDGPSLLAWVGVIQEDRPRRAERERLRSLRPALHRRLLAQRVVGTESAWSSLATVTEEISAAAYLVRPDGRVLHANAVARTEGNDGAALLLVVATSAARTVHAASRAAERWG